MITSRISEDTREREAERKTEKNTKKTFLSWKQSSQWVKSTNICIFEIFSRTNTWTVGKSRQNSKISSHIYDALTELYNKILCIMIVRIFVGAEPLSSLFSRKSRQNKSRMDFPFPTVILWCFALTVNIEYLTLCVLIVLKLTRNGKLFFP